MRRSGRCPTGCREGLLRRGGGRRFGGGQGASRYFGRILLGCPVVQCFCNEIAIARGQSDARDGRGVFALEGRWKPRMAESAVSSPNRRVFEAIMNCSVQLYSTRSTVKGCVIHDICVFKWDKRGLRSCERGTEGVVTDRARSESSRCGQVLCCPNVAEVP